MYAKNDGNVSEVANQQHSEAQVFTDGKSIVNTQVFRALFFDEEIDGD